jgi:kumamolisin
MLTGAQDQGDLQPLRRIGFTDRNHLPDELHGVVTAVLGLATVWNEGPNSGATGGGVSSFFALPSYQEGLQVTRIHGGTEALAMRGVPDVAGDADPQTGYDVRVDGQNTVIGGTSAVAPLWAGLIARINAAKARRAGFINPHLYVNAPALHDITQGNNGDFAATTGWDACTGLGSPNGQKVADAV